MDSWDLLKIKLDTMQLMIEDIKKRLMQVRDNLVIQALTEGWTEEEIREILNKVDNKISTRKPNECATVNR